MALLDLSEVTKAVIAVIKQAFVVIHPALQSEKCPDRAQQYLFDPGGGTLFLWQWPFPCRDRSGVERYQAYPIGGSHSPG